MPRITLAGATGRTLLAECPGALLQCFSTPDACGLRLVCSEFQAAVAAHPWEDRETVIKGDIGGWRACFPRARCANVNMYTRRSPVVDADFVHFVGLWELNMARCRAVTDAAFVHLRGIRVLNMSRCTQLTDAAFAHLKGIQTLLMYGCKQPTITDAGLAHLRGIHALVMEGCTQATITGAGLAHLAGIANIGMCYCREGAIAAAEDLGLPVAKFLGMEYGPFDCAFEDPAYSEDEDVDFLQEDEEALDYLFDY